MKQKIPKIIMAGVAIIAAAVVAAGIGLASPGFMQTRDGADAAAQAASRAMTFAPPKAKAP